ncbi:hypothetical protein MMC18_006135 [Xylographa bjoerkii]|nr:hypothetical protein [Xylographa bjoerkii]
MAWKLPDSQPNQDNAQKSGYARHSTTTYERLMRTARMMTTHDIDHTGDTVVNFKGAAVFHTEPQLSSKVVAQGLIEDQETTRDGVSSEEQMKMRTQWNKVMCREMEVPQGYQNVAVLIIKWCKELDELNSADEVETLDQLLRGGFNYSTQTVEIDNKNKPQHQLNKAVADFVCDYDGPHNLLIVYYTGHGSYNEVTKDYVFHASNTDLSTTDDKYLASASWTKAERPLTEDAECDVLLIVDACFASNMTKGRQHGECRVYELLCASPINKPTDGPGPKSFTTALISSLKKLLKECGDKVFYTKQLCDEINWHPERTSRQCHHWQYNHNYIRHIEWVPLKHTLDQRKQEFRHDDTRALLLLRLSLTKDSLDESEIESVAQAICKAVRSKKAPVRRIDWQRLYSSQQKKFANAGIDLILAKKYWRRWRNITICHRSTPEMPDQDIPTNDVRSTQETNNRSAPGSAGIRPRFELTPPATARKRRHSEHHLALEDPPLSKRRSSRKNQRRQKESQPHQQPPGPMTPLSSTDFDKN